MGPAGHPARSLSRRRRPSIARLLGRGAGLVFQTYRGMGSRIGSFPHVGDPGSVPAWTRIRVRIPRSYAARLRSLRTGRGVVVDRERHAKGACEGQDHRLSERDERSRRRIGGLGDREAALLPGALMTTSNLPPTGAVPVPVETLSVPIAMTVQFEVRGTEIRRCLLRWHHDPGRRFHVHCGPRALANSASTLREGRARRLLQTTAPMANPV